MCIRDSSVSVGKEIRYNGKTYPLNSIPDDLMSIIEDGGLVRRMQKLNGKETE